MEGRNPEHANDARETDARLLWPVPTLPRILELAKVGMDDPKALSADDVRNLARALIYQYSTMGVK